MNALSTLLTLRFLHPPRTGGTSIVKAWDLQGTDEYLSHERLPRELGFFPPPDAWRYITVRNPWDRMVSLYHHASRKHDPNPWQFRWWLLNPLEQERNYGGRFRALISRPCADWLPADGVDFIVRFEQRETLLPELAGCLRRPLPKLHENRTKERLPYPEYYDAATRELVGQWYHEDVEAFGYTFEGGA